MGTKAEVEQGLSRSNVIVLEVEYEGQVTAETAVVVAVNFAFHEGVVGVKAKTGDAADWEVVERV